YYVKISDGISPTTGIDVNDPNEPDILYTSMIHSRELSSLMGNIYFMWFLLENYATNSAIKHLVDNNELFFVPIVNPDGLRWNEKEDPNGGGMNRTNLRGYSTSDPTNNSNYIENYGVDPNRNFDYLWGSAGDASGSSSNYWWSTYRGPSAFSEPESQIMRDFILSKNFKTAVWQHSYANAIPHPYGGIPTKVSLREDEMARWHQDMTRYNRYISGAQVLSPANGIADDWMLGGTVDGNGSTGSGMNILATTPENGANDSSEGGFWPAPSDIIPIAKRMVRINLMNAYYGGKYAKFHDLTQSDVATLSSDLTFGVERIGQTSSDFTLQITPTSSNIQSITSPLPATLAGMSVLEQRNVTAALVLNSGIVANEKIEYKVSLSNDDGIIYEANFVKYYQPSVLFEDNPDTDISISNWVVSTNWVNSNLSSWSGSRAIKAGAAIPYASNVNNTLTTTNSFDLSGGNEILIQFYSKWDLERNFDFVEIEGYNGSSWVKLNGKYNKPESSSFTNSARSSYSSDKSVYFNSQATSSGLVYDGDQMDNWVMEEIVIDASNNSSLQNVSNAKFRFNFRTDGNNIGEVNYSSTYEGFYLDDFKIIQITVPCVVSTPTGLNSSLITSSSATVGWDLISSATYDLRYRVVGSSTWTDVLDMATNSHNLTGLTSNTNYEYQVRSVCGATSSSYSSSSLFTTLEPNYCDSSGDTSNRGITNVTFVGETTINKTSISSVDYSDFTDIFSTVDIGNTYNLSITGLTQKITGQTPALNVSVFIDFNGDGDFLDSGETFNNIGTFSDTTPTTISNYGILVPNDSKTGATRMRISAKASSTSSSCETGFSGEVEDYKINIIDSTLGIQDELLSEFVLYPNPVKNGQLKLNVPREITDFNVVISNVLGQTVFERKINDNYSTAHTVNTSNLNPGIYFVTVSTNLGMATKKMIIQ
ncbi:MAG: T9SS type A sorting domain-containing protein, partial [Lutibacter sp.]|uniref:M14 family zinc carboxypeptidase n=1 Tax=Lutibacter sp. TaxID=1925666 RepID=UPI001845571F